MSEALSGQPAARSKAAAQGADQILSLGRQQRTLGPGENALDAARKAKTNFENDLPTVMVMEEMPKPRDAFILIRGQYDKHGDKVSAGVPAALPPLPAGAPANRLGLARWIVDPANPLTARVTVNRFWEMLFGVGIVKSSENFGVQAEWPSNLELLDWLATEFVRDRLGHEGDAEDDRDERHVSASVANHAGDRRSAIRRIACWPAARGSACRPK